MAAQEWWDAVRREVGDMLVPEQAKKMAGTPSEDSPLDVARRQLDLTSELLPPQITTAPHVATTEGTLELAPTMTTATSSTSLVVAPTTAAPQQTSTPDGSESEDGGMGVAAKAGIVIGALGAILALFVVVWLVFSMRKKKLARQRQQMEDDEKINGPFADSYAISAVPAPAPRPTPNKAPRLSLRPVTQFLPNFGTQPHAERRSSRGIPLTLNPVSSQQLSRPTGGSAWERPTLRATTASPNGDYHRPGTSSSLHPNPFHDNHRLPDEPVSPISSMGSFDHRVGTASTPDSIPEPVSPIIGGDDDHDDHDDRDHGRRQNQTQLGVASSLTRKTSIRKDLPKPLDLTKPPSPLYAVPPSPAGTEYSMHSMAPGQSPGPSASAEAIALAGGPSQSAVHRVQLDFKPTLQDELELRAGQLVRVLHEYDDGWALCIRLDRSQQGVVPRTCLSTRPVKPRPQQGGGGGHSPLHGGGNPRGGPPISPSFHFGSGNSPGGLDVRAGNGSEYGSGYGGGSGRSSPAGAGFPTVPSKDERYGGNGYGRPRSPGGGGQGQGRGGRGPPSPAPGQAY